MPIFIVTLAARLVGDRFAKVFAWFAVIAIPLALVGSCVAIERWKAGQSAAATARVGNAQVGAAFESARDAVNATAAAADREATTNAVEKENKDAILNGPGADAPVDPVLADTARRGLCRYAAYRDSPACLRQPAARHLARPD